jgi:3-methyladenine DNA glycosylase AlkC
MTVKVPLKETALNAERIERIGREVHSACPEFDVDSFVKSVTADLPRLELSARIARTSEGLHAHLPVTGPDALDILLRSLPPTPEAAGVTNDFGLHIYSPHSDYVSRYLRTAEHLDQALDALARMTGYFSAELPVRHFLADFPDETMKAVGAWTRDEDFRVRRLASEATRPLLPWAPRIQLPVDAALPVLDQLCDDAHLYVRTSVANHLSDIAASRPDLVLTTLQRWKQSGRLSDEHFAFIARGALRNRLKEGWPPAYAILGYAHDAPIALTPLVLERTELRDGDTLNFSAALTATTTAPVHVMIVIATTGQNGQPREKVSFLRRATAEADRELRLAKAHPLRSTARWKVSPGSYSLALQVNGRRFPSVAFTVLNT